MANLSYDNSEEFDSEGIPTVEDPVNVDEGMIPPRDHAQGTNEYGITADEQRRDEPISQRVLREEPEMGTDDETEPSERYIEPGGYDVDDVDDEKDVVGEQAVEPHTSETAEESAMHVTDER